jgi:exonuclease SbcC
MLSRIFKAKNPLDQSDPGARRRAVEELSTAKTEALQDKLLALAGSDADPGVRRACIAKLGNARSVAGLLNDPISADAAAARVIELIGSDSSSELARHPLVLKTRLLSMSPDDAEPWLADIDDTQFLIDLAIRAARPLREVIVTRLDDAAALTELEHQTRSRDKSLNRYAREGLERIRTARHEAQESRDRIMGLADSLERHQRVDNEPNADQRNAALLREFDQASATFDQLAEQLRQVGENFEPIDDARHRVADIRRQAAEVHAQAATAPKREQQDPFPDLVAALQALHRTMQTGIDFAIITSERQTLSDQWLRAADHVPPDPSQHEVFESVSHAYQQLAASISKISAVTWPDRAHDPLPDPIPQEPHQLHKLWQQADARRRALKQSERLIHNIAWPEWAKPSAEYADLLQRINQMERELVQTNALEESLTTQLQELATQLGREIEEGAFKTAATTLNNGRQLSKSLPEHHVPNLVKQLNRDAARLAELRDWQTFATTPKREAMCEAVRALVDNPFDPQDQADRIKRLRAEWVELGPATQNRDHKLAHQFNALAEQAFEPCRAYFGEQAEVRKTNLNERHKICDQLESYLEKTDWPNADLKAAEQILRTARSEWRRFHPVDRNPGKPQDERFEKLQGQLHNLLKAQWDANLKLKGSIVEEANALLASDNDIADRIDGAKALQRRWREVGVTPRQPDQNLWREFRATCDAIFAARDDAKQQADKAIQQTTDAATALVHELEELVANTTATTANEGVIRDFKERFASIGLLPERTHQETQRRLDELSNSYRALLQRKARDAEHALLEQFKVWDVTVSEAEAQYRKVGNRGELTLPDSVFEPRLATIDDDVPLLALRTQAIQAELFAEVDSPEGERELRLQIQVDRLNAGMGQRQDKPDPYPKAQELARAWCATGPKHDGCEELRQRLFASLARAMDA